MKLSVFRVFSSGLFYWLKKWRLYRNYSHFHLLFHLHLFSWFFIFHSHFPIKPYVNHHSSIIPFLHFVLFRNMTHSCRQKIYLCLKATHYTAIGHYYQRKVYSFCFCEYLAISAFSLLSPSISSFGNIKSSNMIANCALSVELETKFSQSWKRPLLGMS